MAKRKSKKEILNSLQDDAVRIELIQGKLELDEQIRYNKNGDCIKNPSLNYFLNECIDEGCRFVLRKSDFTIRHKDSNAIICTVHRVSSNRFLVWLNNITVKAIREIAPELSNYVQSLGQNTIANIVFENNKKEFKALPVSHRNLIGKVLGKARIRSSSRPEPLK